LVFITEMKSVYSAVRTGSLNKAVCASSLKYSKAFESAFICYKFLEQQISGSSDIYIYIYMIQKKKLLLSYQRNVCISLIRRVRNARCIL